MSVCPTLFTVQQKLVMQDDRWRKEVFLFCGISFACESSIMQARTDKVRSKLKIAPSISQSRVIHPFTNQKCFQDGKILTKNRWHSSQCLLFFLLSECPGVWRGQKNKWRWWQRKGRRGEGGRGWQEQWWRFHGNDSTAAGSSCHGEDGGVCAQGNELTLSQNILMCFSFLQEICLMWRSARLIPLLHLLIFPRIMFDLKEEFTTTLNKST